MKKEKYYVRLWESKVEVEGFVMNYCDRKFGIDKRGDYGWCITDIKTGLKTHPLKTDHFSTKKEAIEYIKTFTVEKFNTDLVQEQLLKAEEKLQELWIDKEYKLT